MTFPIAVRSAPDSFDRECARAAHVPVYTLNPLADPRWSDLVAAHPSASVAHTIGWLAALHRTHGYEPIVYTTSPPASPLANGIVFAGINSWLTGRRLVSLPFVDHCEPLVANPGERQELIGSIQASARHQRLKTVEIRPRYADGWLERNATPARSFVLHQLDLRPSLDDLFHATHKNCIQRVIRRSRREMLDYEQGRSEQLLSKFYRLLILTRRRHRLPPQPISWFRNLIEGLNEQLTIHVASKSGRDIASILTVRCRRTLLYKYGCSDEKFHSLGGIPFLLWKAIEEAKRAGLESFDLGRSDLDNHGLIRFKDRWGAASTALTYFSCAGSPRPREPLGAGIAKRLLACMPDSVLTGAGRMFYRHVG